MICITLTICFSALFGNTISFADDSDGFDVESSMPGPVQFLLDGLVWLITLIPKLILMLIGLIIQLVLDAVGSAVADESIVVTIENIIFSGSTVEGFEGVDLLSMDFFTFTGVSDTARIFREAVAQWYYILRLISTSALLVMLIYVGIRMALSTIASEQAKCKQMLADWVTSLALLFVLHYIIQIVISINTSLINVLATIAKNSTLVDGKSIGAVFDSCLVNTIFSTGVGGIFSTIIYFILKGQSLMFFVYYMKRMVTVAFLIMIAPLITITYSLDKMGDGKAQAFNTWLKEFAYNVLIQPFHCIIYISFFGAIANLLKGNKYSISAYILGFIIIKFMKTAEEILKKIFHFEASSMSSMGEAGQNLMNATGKFASAGIAAGRGAVKIANGVKQLPSDFSKMKNNIKSNKDLKSGFKNDSALKSKYSSFREYKNSEEGQKNLQKIKKTNSKELKEQRDAKREAKARKVAGKKGEDFDAKVKEEAKNVSGKDIEARARKDYDAKFGEGSYDKVKATAEKKDANGNPTSSAKKAQKILNGQHEKAKNKIATEKATNSVLANTKPAKTARAIRGATSTVGGAMKKFGNTTMGAYVKDSAKVALKVAAASTAYGYAFHINDAQSALQLTDGFIKGLDQTNSTVKKDTVDNAQKYMEVTGAKPEDMSELFKSIESKGKLGNYDNMHKVTADFEKELTRILSDKTKALDFSNKIQSNIQEEGGKINIDQLVRDLNKDGKISTSDIDTITEIANDYSRTVVEKNIYNNIQYMQNSGSTTEVLSEYVEKKTEKIIEREVTPPPTPTGNPTP